MTSEQMKADSQARPDLLVSTPIERGGIVRHEMECTSAGNIYWTIHRSLWATSINSEYGRTIDALVSSGI